MDGYWLFNTNETYRPDTRCYMVEHSCICAQYEAKDCVGQVAEGDVVFIYENGTGIIAYGIADGQVRVTNYEGHVGERHQMQLSPFRELESPIAPSVISEAAKDLDGSGVFYAKTISPLKKRTGEQLRELARTISQSGPV
jgi:hypothetical protein